MAKPTIRVTADMVKRVNTKRILAKKSGTPRVLGVDFLGEPIDVSVPFDPDEVRRAWRAVNERFART